MEFRIDDVSLNTDVERLETIVSKIRECFPQIAITIAVSPMVFDMTEDDDAMERERPFPRIFSAFSDFRRLYRIKRIGLPDLSTLGPVVIASHGLVHVDHRLMSKSTQELSILSSCSILDSFTFVPPFNKYNADTEEICAEHAIDLVRFENGWRHIGFTTYSPAIKRYYLHTHDTTLAHLDAWLGRAIVAGIGKT